MGFIGTCSSYLKYRMCVRRRSTSLSTFAHVTYTDRYVDGIPSMYGTLKNERRWDWCWQSTSFRISTASSCYTHFVFTNSSDIIPFHSIRIRQSFVTCISFVCLCIATAEHSRLSIGADCSVFFLSSSLLLNKIFYTKIFDWVCRQTWNDAKYQLRHVYVEIYRMLLARRRYVDRCKVHGDGVEIFATFLYFVPMSGEKCVRWEIKSRRS